MHILNQFHYYKIQLLINNVEIMVVYANVAKEKGSFFAKGLVELRNSPESSVIGLFFILHDHE